MKTKIFFIAFFISQLTFCQTIVKSSIDNGGASVNNANIYLVYTIGEVIVQETTVGNISISEGFISPIILKIHIDPKILLQGPYDSNTGNMFDNLRITTNIPTTTPYVDAITCDASVFNVSGNNAIIDWVWVEIRDSADGTTVITSTSALLQADGDIVDVDGISLLSIDVPFGDYYFMVGHRNHIGVLTASSVSLAGGVMTLDLTGDSVLVEGGNNGIKDMGDGNFALYAGDYNGNGQIQNTDKNAVEPLRGISGYNNADVDMNGEVQNTDIQSTLNPNIGKGQQFTSRMLFAKRKVN